MLQNLINTYREKYVAYEEAAHKNYLYVSSLENEADALCELAEKKRLAAKRAKADFNQKNPCVYWFDEVVVPLFNKLADRAGMSCRIMGPSGLAARCTLVMYKDNCKSWHDQERWYLIVRPSIEENSISFEYETGEVKEDYPVDSIGAMNGMNRVTKPLPETLDGILSVLSYEDWEV